MRGQHWASKLLVSFGEFQHFLAINDRPRTHKWKQKRKWANFYLNFFSQKATLHSPWWRCEAAPELPGAPFSRRTPLILGVFLPHRRHTGVNGRAHEQNENRRAPSQAPASRGRAQSCPTALQEEAEGAERGEDCLFVSWNTLLRISAIAVSARSFGKRSSFSSFPAARDLIRKHTILHSTLKWKTAAPGGRQAI